MRRGPFSPDNSRLCCLNRAHPIPQLSDPTLRFSVHGLLSRQSVSCGRGTLCERRDRGITAARSSSDSRQCAKTGCDPKHVGHCTLLEPEILCLQPLRVLTLLRALGLAARRWKRIADLARVLLRGKESPKRRLKALLHTWLGACYAVQLRERGVDHIHVHHGYFGSWIAMVAARLLGVSYSLTLHGSDLLIDGAYLGTKLGNCRFCTTVSEYNRRHILEHFPAVDSGKIVVSRLGVDVPEHVESPRRVARGARRTLTLL